MKMKKTIFLMLALMFVCAAGMNAQVTVGSTADPRATLDVITNATVPAGIIAPHVSGTVMEGAGYGAPQKGAIAYAIAPFGTTVTAEGYYYFDGTEWKPFGGGGAAAKPFVVSPVITASFTVTNEDFVRLNPTGTITLTLPTGDNAPVGRILYVSNRSGQAIDLIPQPVPEGRKLLAGFDNATLIHLGGGEWDSASGY